MAASKHAAFDEFDDPRDLREEFIDLSRQKAEIEAKLATIRAAMEFEEWQRKIPNRDGTNYDDAPMESGEKTLCVKDLMLRFDRGNRWVYKKIRTGELKPIKSLGTPFRFRPTEVDRFEQGWKRRRD